ncbi:MAG: hypothetical protein PGN37_13010 [Mycobacterium kyogaense]|uniref:hypothetical protein n=1 Tax=Mycobacterium kyogaense TaxID=2212479 RepID=UPI002FF87379
MPGQLVDVVAAMATDLPDPAVAAVERLLRAPVSVAVRGRAGVGRSTVASALGVPVGAPGETGIDNDADVDVLVVAEAVTDEDRAGVTDATVVVLNKADLGGAAAGGPLRAAQAVAAEIEAVLRRPVVPMVALLAGVRIDDDDVAALRSLVQTPADVSSVDAFAACPHPLPAGVRADLMDRLDRFGLAHAILAVCDGAGADEVTARLRALSGTDAVRAAIGRAAATVRYRRCVAAVRALHVLAAERGDGQLATHLDGDDVVLAVMTAAVDVVEASGATVDRGDDVGAHTRRALRFHHLSRGPLDALHRRCSADITRGSLRLVEVCGG